MSQADELHREGGRGLAAIGAIGSVLFRLIRLPVYGVLVICEPIVQIGLSTIALLGLVATLVLEFSGSAPRFPFWEALLFFGCCGALPLLYRALMRLFAP